MKKELRSLEEITKEHGHVMYQIGAKNYQSEVLKAELNQLYQRAQQLNIEAHEVQSAPKEETPAPQPQPTETEVNPALPTEGATDAN